jgi:hypothetical protein
MAMVAGVMIVSTVGVSVAGTNAFFVGGSVAVTKSGSTAVAEFESTPIEMQDVKSKTLIRIIFLNMELRKYKNNHATFLYRTKLFLDAEKR